jgi:hypothetical protein
VTIKLWQRFMMCNNLAYNSKSGNTEVLYDQLFYPLPKVILNDFFNTLNA